MLRQHNRRRILTIHFVYFATGSHALTPEDQDHIRDVAAMMQRTPTFVATIVGKADSVGSADFNEHLSQRRAEAVFEALVYTNKVPENRVQLHWTGERLPIISTADEQAESHNRMAAIIVSDAASATLWQMSTLWWVLGRRHNTAIAYGSRCRRSYDIMQERAYGAGVSVGGSGFSGQAPCLRPDTLTQTDQI